MGSYKIVASTLPIVLFLLLIYYYIPIVGNTVLAIVALTTIPYILVLYRISAPTIINVALLYLFIGVLTNISLIRYRHLGFYTVPSDAMVSIMYLYPLIRWLFSVHGVFSWF